VSLHARSLAHLITACTQRSFLCCHFYPSVFYVSSYLPDWLRFYCTVYTASASIHFVCVCLHVLDPEPVFVNVYGAQESIARNRLESLCSLTPVAGQYDKEGCHTGPPGWESILVLLKMSTITCSVFLHGIVSARNSFCLSLRYLVFIHLFLPCLYFFFFFIFSACHSVS
jgi:hypothetical protein